MIQASFISCHLHRDIFQRRGKTRRKIAAAAAALAANGRQIGVVVSGQGKGWLALAGGSQGVHRVVALFVAIAEASNKLRPTVVEVYWVSMV